MHIDEGRENFPRDRIIKEAQVSPISKPYKLGYMMSSHMMYNIK
jgi:hypothetical protein